MTITIYPSRPGGPVEAPPSKSYAHRLLIAAGLAKGKSRIKNITGSEDILATIDCLRALGAKIRAEGNDCIITGTDPRSAGPAELPCRESGSTLRFFMPLAALCGEEMTFRGSSRLLERPLSVYEDIFNKQGIGSTKSASSIKVRGILSGGDFSVPGNISSQFITGLLFALPLLRDDSVIRLTQPAESRPYIDMTIRALSEFGTETGWSDDLTLYVPGGQEYRAADLTVEGDWSNAAFWLAMGMDVTGLSDDSLQGDRVCREYFRRLDDGYCELDISDCPDLGPVLMAYAALREGCILTGTRRLRIKESDRGEAMKEELAKFGAGVITEEDRIFVEPAGHAPYEVLSGHNDHRIVMSLAVMCIKYGGTIEGAEAVRKSYPDFFEKLSEAGVKIKGE